MDGTLEIQEDKRISADLREAMWGTDYDPLTVLDKDDEDDAKDYAAFSKEAAAPASLRLVDGKGKVLQALPLTYPLAEIESLKLKWKGHTVYAVTSDGSGPSPHWGKETDLYVVLGKKLEPVVAQNENTHRHEPVKLKRSNFNFWQIAQGKNGWELQQVDCRGGFGDGKPDSKPVRIVYTATRFEGTQATSRSRDTRNYSCPEELPTPSDFP